MNIQEALDTLSGDLTMIHNLGILSVEECNELFDAEAAIYDFVGSMSEE